MVWLPGSEKSFKDMFIRFDRKYEREGQTDIQCITAKGALDASIARQKSTQYWSGERYHQR